MLRRKIIWFTIAMLVVFVAIQLVITYMNSTIDYYHVFEDQRELFDAVKDDVDSITDSIAGYQRNSGDIFLYRNGGNAAPDQFHDEVSGSLRGKIEHINESSGNKLDHLRYAESDENILIRFIFDWERAYGDTYHIVYCKSQEEVMKLYNDKNVKYNLKGLDDDWYGITVR